MGYFDFGFLDDDRGPSSLERAYNQTSPEEEERQQQAGGSSDQGFSSFLSNLTGGASLLNSIPAGSGLSFSLPGAAAVIAGGATGAKQLSGLEEIAHGGNPSAIEHAALFLPTGGTSLLAPLVSSTFGSGKDSGQREREAVIGSLKAEGLVDDDDHIRFSDGTEFNLGREHDEETGERLYELDHNDSANAEIIGLLNPFSYLKGDGEESRLVPQLTARLVRAVRKSGDPRKAAREIYEKGGLDYAKALNGLVQLQAKHKINYSKFAALKNGLKQVYGVKA